MKNSIPETNYPILERATFEFSQESNGLSNPDASEFLTIECESSLGIKYRDWETDRKSTRLNSSHSAKSRMPSSA